MQAEPHASPEDRRELAVPDAIPPVRIDAWIAKALADVETPLSRSRVKALIEANAVTVDGVAATDAAYRLRGGERIVVHVPPPIPARPDAEPFDLDVLHEDDELIVLVKPTGMVVHPGAGVRSGTLVNALLHHCGRSLSGIGGVARPGIVHRLDRDTSGVMVVAKTDRAHASLSAQFADHGRNGPLERRYIALVWGRPTPPAGTIDAPLGRDVRDRTRRAVTTGADSRAAITHYRTRDDLGSVSLVECRLETGRTHQIRVHMAYRGHPLLGDDVYGAGYRSKLRTLAPNAAMAARQLPGQALHAELLAFEHPTTGSTMRFEAPPPASMRRLMDALAEGS